MTFSGMIAPTFTAGFVRALIIDLYTLGVDESHAANASTNIFEV